MPRRSHAAHARLWKFWRIAHWTILAMLGMSLLGAAFMYWHNVLEEQLFPKRFATVEDGRIYRSGQIDAGLLHDTFTEHDIRVIVDLAGYESKHLPNQKAEERVARELGIEHLRLPLDGSGVGDLRTFALAIAQIDRAVQEQKPVLVHCTAGSRRSASVLAAYLLLVEEVPVDVAWEEIERYGSSSLHRSPMVPFLNENLGAIAEILVEMDVIETAPDPVPRFAWDS